jgi:hypothetical protein
MSIQSLNTNTYVQTVSTSSVSITLAGNDLPAVSPTAKNATVILSNGGSNPIFAVSGPGATTAVFPSSATVPVQGKVILPGTVQDYLLPDGHTVIAFIASAGSGSMFVSIGPGD